MTTLQQIRERDTELIGYDEQDLSTANRDRRHLLSLVERMRPYVRIRPHSHNCPVSQGSASTCTCGLDALLEELK